MAIWVGQLRLNGWGIYGHMGGTVEYYVDTLKETGLYAVEKDLF